MALVNNRRKNNLINIFFISFIILSVGACGDSDEDESLSVSQPIQQRPTTPTPLPIDPSQPNNPTNPYSGGVDLPVGYSSLFQSKLNGVGTNFNYSYSQNSYPYPQMNYTRYNVTVGTRLQVFGTVMGGTYYRGFFDNEKCGSQSRAEIPIFINGAFVTYVSSLSSYTIRQNGVLEIGTPSATHTGTRFICYYYNDFQILLYRNQ